MIAPITVSVGMGIIFNGIPDPLPILIVRSIGVPVTVPSDRGGLEAWTPSSSATLPPSVSSRGHQQILKTLKTWTGDPEVVSRPFPWTKLLCSAL